MTESLARPKRWSYSALSTWKGCPAQYKYSYIDRLPDVAGPAAERGTRLHSLCEDVVNGKLPHIPNDLRKIGLRLLDFQQRKANTEAVWLLDKEWKPADNEGAWIKGIIDVHYVQDDVLHVVDYKSGQMYPEHVEQLELYAVMGMYLYPDVKRAEYSALYIDDGCHGAVGGVIRPMVDRLRDKWQASAEEMYNDQTFDPRPGRACRWCAYKKSKGGPCAVGI